MRTTILFAAALVLVLPLSGCGVKGDPLRPSEVPADPAQAGLKKPSNKPVPERDFVLDPLLD